MLHYDPATLTSPNAAHVAACMTALRPGCDEAEVRTAARAFARTLGGAWADLPEAAAFWADSVAVNYRLQDADRPF
jgi:hypothetical protein